MNLTGWLNQVITVQSPTGSSNYGDPTWSNRRSVRARVQLRRTKTRSAAGEVVDMTHELFTLEALTINDRIWIPGADTTDAKQARRPVNVTAVVDKAGHVHHYEVAL